MADVGTDTVLEPWVSRYVEAAPEPEPTPRRILESVTWVDPVQQMLADAQPRRRGRPPKTQVAQTEKRRPGRPRIHPLQQAQVAPPPQPIAAAPQTLVARTRKRHPEPRIFYNTWGYRNILFMARGKPREVAATILKPGQRWKHRLPQVTWHP